MRTATTNRTDHTEPFKERITTYINIYGDTSQFHKYRRHRPLFLPILGYSADLSCFSLYDIFCLCYLSYSQKWNNLLPETETDHPVPPSDVQYCIFSSGLEKLEASRSWNINYSLNTTQSLPSINKKCYLIWHLGIHPIGFPVKRGFDFPLKNMRLQRDSSITSTHKHFWLSPVEKKETGEGKMDESAWPRTACDVQLLSDRWGREGFPQKTQLLQEVRSPEAEINQMSVPLWEQLEGF